jgi:hypothetical protein
MITAARVQETRKSSLQPAKPGSNFVATGRSSNAQRAAREEEREEESLEGKGREQ